MKDMFDILCEINRRPRPFERYTAEELWTGAHTSGKMLEYHLDESVDISSRKPGFIERSVAWMTGYFGLNSGSKMIDFGCGPGLYAIRFARGGVRVTGIDFSERSIEHAARSAANEGLSVEYVHADYLEYDAGDRYDLVMMIMCDYCALGPAQRARMLGKFRDVLKPGGGIVLDVYTLNAFAAREEGASYERNQMSNFWSPDDHFVFLNTFKYDDEKVVLDKYTIIEKERDRVVYNWLQYFSPGSLKKEFEENGLKIVETFSDVAGSAFRSDAMEMAVVARAE